MVTAIKGNATSTFGGNIDVTGNVITDAPAFSAYASANTAISAATFTKINFQSEEFDLTSNYDTSTSKFTPSVAGYYQVNAAWSASTNFAFGELWIYKNGSGFKRGQATGYSSNSSSGYDVSALIYCNGTTDYLEVYLYCNLSNNTNANGATTYFQGYLARAA